MTKMKKSLLTGTLRTMIKESISRNYVLKIQIFTFVLTIITQIFITKLLILLLQPIPQRH